MDELIKHQNVINYVKAQRLSRSEHINTRRMSKSGTVKKIHKWKPFTRRLVGRPKSRQDYYDLLRRAKWKSQEATRWDERVGNYLSMLIKDSHKGQGKPDPSPRWAKECRPASCEAIDDMDIQLLPCGQALNRPRGFL